MEKTENKIVNMINKKFNLNLYTIDSMAMSEEIKSLFLNQCNCTKPPIKEDIIIRICGGCHNLVSDS